MKLARGNKRSCQNASCQMPFYDLNRTAFACPNCGADFDMAVLAEAESRARPKESQRRYFNRPFAREAAVVPPVDEPADLESADDETAEETVGAIDGDIILETEDDDTDAIGDVPSASRDE